MYFYKGKSKKLANDEVSVNNCTKGKCILQRRTDAAVEIKLKPEKDIQRLRTDVSAIILDVPLPFIGVDGTSACDNIYTEDGATKVGCPLKAGQTYLYKNKFRVQEFYPTVNLIVHWALNDGKDDLVCFEVPAKIK